MPNFELLNPFVIFFWLMEITVTTELLFSNFTSFHTHWRQKSYPVSYFLCVLPMEQSQYALRLQHNETNQIKMSEGPHCQCCQHHFWDELKLKMTACWDIAPCSVEVDQRFGGTYCLHHCPDDSGTHHRNVGLLQADYIALYPRRHLDTRLFEHLKSQVLKFIFIFVLRVATEG
jgi:hypothetical protein